MTTKLSYAALEDLGRTRLSSSFWPSSSEMTPVAPSLSLAGGATASPSPNSVNVMTNRTKLPHGDWVTVFSSGPRAGSVRQAGLHQDAPGRRHRHRTAASGGALGGQKSLSTAEK